MIKSIQKYHAKKSYCNNCLPTIQKLVTSGWYTSDNYMKCHFVVLNAESPNVGFVFQRKNNDHYFENYLEISKPYLQECNTI